MPVINGPSAICYNSTATYTLSNVANGAIITWGTSNAYRTVTPSVDNLSASVKNISASNLSAAISVSVNGCSGQLSSSKSIALGAPFVTGSFTNTFDNSANALGIYPYITNSACTGYYINTNMQITGAIGVPNVTWSKLSSTGVVNFTQPGNDIQFYLFGDNQNVLFQLAAQNGCGTTTQQFAWQSHSCSTGGGGGGGCFKFDVSPNPSDGDINVDVPSILPPCNIEGINGSQSTASLFITQVSVYDVAHNLKAVVKNKGTKQCKVSLSNLKSGVYFVEIVGTNNYRERQIVYKH